MNLTEKLDRMMEERGINKNILSKESGIPYSTIDSLYKKGYSNMKLSTLKTICDYFNVSADYLMSDDPTILNISDCTRPYITSESNITKESQRIFNNLVETIYKEARNKWLEEKEAEKVLSTAIRMDGEAR